MRPLTAAWMADAARTLRVAVLVDLIWSEAAGGHVKFWERAARGAAGLAGLDLTVYFAAAADGEHVIAPNVRYRLLRPVFGTQRLPDHGRDLTLLDVPAMVMQSLRVELSHA